MPLHLSGPRTLDARYRCVSLHTHRERESVYGVYVCAARLPLYKTMSFTSVKVIIDTRYLPQLDLG